MSLVLHLFYCRNLRRCLTEDVVRDLMGNAQAIEELDKEWQQLLEDRQMVRHIFPKGESQVRMKIWHIAMAWCKIAATALKCILMG